MSGRSSATAEPGLRVLYDGWPLGYAPGSPAALHLLEILTLLPEGVEAVVALPFGTPLDGVTAKVVMAPHPNVLRSRLAWEQITLSQLARRCRANLLHLTAPYPPLFKTVPTLVSPAEPIAQGDLFVSGGQRLRAALSRGAFSSGTTLLWPADLPEPEGLQSTCRYLPPVVHPAFAATPPAGLASDSLPEGYIYAPGPFTTAQAADLLAAWSWATAGLGADWALVVSGGLPDELEALRARLAPDTRLHVLAGDTSPPAPLHFRKSGENREGSKKEGRITPHALAHVLHQAGAVLRVGTVAAWGDPLLYALAAGKGLAVLAAADPEQRRWQDARLGGAAFLTGDLRSLGAAVLSLIVEDELNQRLAQAAQERAAGWGSARFGLELGKVYRELARR